MRQLTFNKVYIGLLTIALISALVVPKPISSSATAGLARFFAPVSWSVRLVIGPVYRRLHPEPLDIESPTGVPRTYQQIAQENRELRVALANMTEENRRLQEINGQREALGPLKQYARMMRVVGTDTSQRRSLSLQGNIEGLRAGMAVLYIGGLVGKLDRIGWAGGAQVQLVTDRGFRIGARFGRIIAGEARYQPIGEFACVVSGNGRSGMVARNVQMKALSEAGLVVGDWAVVADADFPAGLQGYRIGQVTAIRPSRSSPLFAEIDLKTQENLELLPEVMVLVR
jgi:cell shape-determining protein MreC